MSKDKPILNLRRPAESSRLEADPCDGSTAVHTIRDEPSVNQPETAFYKSLCDALTQLNLRDCRVLVGVSGGADSVALLSGLNQLAIEFGLSVHAAHLNHQIRGAAADADAEWTEALGQKLGVPIRVERIDVPARAVADRLNLEEAARVARYEFLERAARQFACSHVAVAHNADDRVETVLHHLLRGTGLAGLAAMHASRALADGITLVRPLLSIRRTKIEAWLAEIGQDFRHDATNADTERTRSRIRHQLLPALEQDFGPHVRDSLTHLADQAREMQSTIAQLARTILHACLLDDSPELCRLDCHKLADQPAHLVREVFVELWKQMHWPRQQMGFVEWDRLYRLVKEGGRATLPDKIDVTRRGTLLILERRR